MKNSQQTSYFWTATEKLQEVQVQKIYYSFCIAWIMGSHIFQIPLLWSIFLALQAAFMVLMSLSDLTGWKS